MVDFNFELNKAGIEQFERDLQERFSAGIQIPLGGSEDDAIRSVKDQLEKMGVTPNDSEVQKLVREARES
ncbi:hypothetical protein [Mycobacterium avium]|uniref:hypothetical protein n=1 Tax=Mycobacterium avium TaxID=1764 RepID=UPI0007A0B4EA|nr:hypothetical protein [Mycobacterium avium]